MSKSGALMWQFPIIGISKESSIRLSSRRNPRPTLTPRHGGRMLTSAGHWKELVHLGGVSEEALLRVAERACAGL